MRFLALARVLALVAACPGCSASASGEGRDASVCTAKPPAGGAGFFPCDVGAIIEDKCQRCHTTEDRQAVCLANHSCAAAPFPLLDWADTQVDLGGIPVFERMKEAVRSGYMPFQDDPDVTPAVERLSDEEKRVLVAWTEACAPAAGSSCADARPPGPADAGQ